MNEAGDRTFIYMMEIEMEMVRVMGTGIGMGMGMGHGDRDGDGDVMMVIIRVCRIHLRSSRHCIWSKEPGFRVLVISSF